MLLPHHPYLNGTYKQGKNAVQSQDPAVRPPASKLSFGKAGWKDPNRTLDVKTLLARRGLPSIIPSDRRREQ